MKAEPATHPRIRLRFRWFDLWVGAFWDRDERVLYVCPLPALVIELRFWKPRLAQPPVFRGSPPSEEFRESFSTASTLCQVTCSPCGRTHYVSGEMAQGTYETGELEELEAEAAKRPGWFVREEQYDDISFAYVGGRTVVLECPCNWLRIWESFIRQAERPLASFLRKRAREERALAAGKVELSEKLEVTT